MNDCNRLTYLARHYYELQALRFAPLWIAFLAGLVYNSVPGHWVAQGPAGRILPFLGLLAVEILWYWTTMRYYRWRFGRLEVNQTALTIGFNWVWIYFALEFCSNKPWSSTPWNWSDSPWFAGPVIAIMLILPTFDSQNSLARRVEYAVGSALIATVTTLSSLCRWDARGFIAITCVTVLALGIADHVLLMSLRAPRREDADV